MFDALKKLWKHTKLFFFTVGLVFISLGFFLTQIPSFGEERLIQIRPQIAIKVTATSALGYLLIGIGLLSWMAIVGSILVSSEER